MNRQHQQMPPWYRGPAATVTAVAVTAFISGAAVGLTVTDPATVTRTVTHTPAACLDALDQVDRALERAIVFGQSMVDMSKSDGGMHSFAVEGSHHQDSLRFTQHMTGVAEAFRTDKTTCRQEGGTP